MLVCINTKYLSNVAFVMYQVIKWFDQCKVLAIAMFCGAVSLTGLLFIKNRWQIVLTLCIFNAIVEPGWSSLNVVSTELSPTHVHAHHMRCFHWTNSSNNGNLPLNILARMILHLLLQFVVFVCCNLQTVNVQVENSLNVK